MSDISTQQSEEYCLDVSRLAAELHPEWHDVEFESTMQYLDDVINYNAMRPCSHELIEVQPLWTSMEFALRDWKSARLPPKRPYSSRKRYHGSGQLPFVSETLLRAVTPLAKALCSIAFLEPRDDIVSLIREAQRNAYQVKQMLEEAWDVSKEAREGADA